MFYLSDLLHGGVSTSLVLGRISPEHILAKIAYTHDVNRYLHVSSSSRIGSSFFQLMSC
jgi:hypothetical protein